MTPAAEIDFLNEDNYLSFIYFELGDAINYLAIENGAFMKDFYVNAFNFIFSVSLDIKKRFNNFEDDVFSAFKCLNPLNALNSEFHNENEQLFENYLNLFSYLLEEESLENVKKNNGLY